MPWEAVADELGATGEAWRKRVERWLAAWEKAAAHAAGKPACPAPLSFPAAQKARLFAKIRDSLRPGGVYLQCDYEAKTQQIEDLLFAECARRRARDGIAPDVFVHFDTPLTLEHEMQAMRDAGFARVELVGYLPEDDHTPMIRAVR